MIEHFRKGVFYVLRIILVRHGETVWNQKGEFYEDPEIGLTELGERQAKAVGSKLFFDYAYEGKVGGDVVAYCSPYQRAKETCRIALESSGIDCYVCYDDRLRERDLTGLTGIGINPKVLGKPYVYGKVLSMKDYRDVWTEGSLMAEKFGVEPISEVKVRAKDCLEDFKVWHPDGTVLIFSHGGLGLVMQALCEGWPKDGCLYKRDFPENGGIAEFFYE